MVIVVLAWWPKSYLEPITVGIDAYKYHAPIFRSHTQSQTLEVSQPLEALGALIVPLRREGEVPPITVTFTNANTRETLQTQTIPGSALQDDTFAFIKLTPSIQADTPIKVTFSAPTAKATTALGIRFHPDNVYDQGERFFDEKPTHGDLALSLEKKLPLWQIALKIAHYNATKTTIILQAFAIAIVLALLANQIGWSARSPLVRRRMEYGIIAILITLTIGSRLPTLSYLGGVSGGDPYNYLLITHALSQFDNPFEGTKRLPGFPALIMPAYLTSLDDITWMRLINIVSAGGIVGMTMLLVRRLRLSWAVQLFAGALLAVQKDFFWISLRPEAYTFYAFLLVVSLVLFFSLTTWPRRLAFGLVLGYAALTRQEGFALAATLGCLAIIHMIANTRKTTANISTKKIATRYLQAFLPALILVAPFFLNNFLAFGNPLYTPYFKGERLNIVDSWPAFIDAAGATWGIMGSLWKTNWDQLERLPLQNLLLFISSGGAVLWWLYHQRRLPRQSLVESVALWVASGAIVVGAIFAYAQRTNAFAPLFTVISAGILLVSPLATSITAKWRGLVLVIIMTTQILIATWFHPFPKHYQQDLSLLMIGIAILLIAPAAVKNVWPRLAIGATHGAIAFVFALSILHLYEPGRLISHLDEENQQNALDSVVYRAVSAATKLPGPYGVDQGHLPARLYLQSEGNFYENLENSTPTLEADWLNHNHIQTLIFTNSSSVFTNLSPEWELEKTFKAEGKDEQLLESFVYRRTPQ